MNILAVDPGTEKSAWVILHNENIVRMGIDENSHVLKILSETIVDTVVIEMIASYGMAVGKEVFETCVWIGRFIQACDGNSPVERIFRHEIKMYLCGNTRAKDSNIRQALLDRYGPPGTKKAPGKLYGIKKDMWAALAVAVTFQDRVQ